MQVELLGKKSIEISIETLNPSLESTGEILRPTQKSREKLNGRSSTSQTANICASNPKRYFLKNLGEILKKIWKTFHRNPKRNSFRKSFQENNIWEVLGEKQKFHEESTERTTGEIL